MMKETPYWAIRRYYASLNIGSRSFQTSRYTEKENHYGILKIIQATKGLEIKKIQN
jgi:hypothetical protein